MPCCPPLHAQPSSTSAREDGGREDGGWKPGAGDETRTRDIDLGKVALYQLSYSRTASRILASPLRSSSHIGQMTTINSAIRAAVRLISAALHTSTGYVSYRRTQPRSHGSRSNCWPRRALY